MEKALVFFAEEGEGPAPEVGLIPTFIFALI